MCPQFVEHRSCSRILVKALVFLKLKGLSLSCCWHICCQDLTASPICFGLGWSTPLYPAHRVTSHLSPRWSSHILVNPLSHSYLLCLLLETSGSLLFLVQALGNLEMALCQAQPPRHFSQKLLLLEPCQLWVSFRGGHLFRLNWEMASAKQRVPTSRRLSDPKWHHKMG